MHFLIFQTKIEDQIDSAEEHEHEKALGKLGYAVFTGIITWPFIIISDFHSNHPKNNTKRWNGVGWGCLNTEQMQYFYFCPVLGPRHVSHQWTVKVKRNSQLAFFINLQRARSRFI